MGSEDAPQRQHPVLAAQIVRADGSHQLGLRVYCDVRQRSVSLDVCRQCPACIGVEGGERDGESWVRCAPRPETVPEGLPLSGSALRRGVVAVGEDVLVRDVVALFVEHGLRMVVVTDQAGRAGGVVHESQLLREIQDHTRARSRDMRLGWQATAAEPASAIMAPPATILESETLRDALMSMVHTHQRQLIVVDEQGFPIGLLIDVDALHALYGAPEQPPPAIR